MDLIDWVPANYIKTETLTWKQYYLVVNVGTSQTAWLHVLTPSLTTFATPTK